MRDTERVAARAPAAYIMREFSLQGEAPEVDFYEASIVTGPEEIYSDQLLALVAAMPRTRRLGAPQATAKAHSKLCGSTVEVDLIMDGEVAADYGQTVRACLLGQTAAAIMGREIVGCTAAELREVGATMRKMLKEGGPPPTGRWKDLALLEPVRNYKARQPSTLLVFDAVEDAIAQIEAKKRDAAMPEQAVISDA